VQLVLKAASFAFLLQFGAELVLSASRDPARAQAISEPLGQPWLRLAPAAATLVWLIGTAALSLIVGRGFTPDPQPWLATPEVEPAIAAVGAPLAIGDVLARVLLALPGAGLAVIGLRRTASALGPLAAPPVGGALGAAAGAFALYALLAGLIGMPAPLPPASFVNSTTVVDLVGIPIEVFRSLAGLAMAVAIIRSLELFEQETDHILAAARRRELLARERERIGADLHDGIVQSIYAAGLHLEQAAADAKPSAPAAVARIGTVLGELNRISGDIRSTIFDLRSSDLDSSDPVEIVTAGVEELRANTAVAVDLEVDPGLVAPLPGERAEQLRHLVTEAFSNVLRHAHARHVVVRLAATGSRLELEIRDDGIGFDVDRPQGRGRRGRAQGIENMRRRAELLGGALTVQSRPRHGTTLSLTMPLAVPRPS
jgi:signal transduction histidine kinase